MKLHSSLVNLKWDVVPASVCPYMRISLDNGSPVIEVSDAVLENYNIDTIVIMFMHEFSHKIFKHLEKTELRLKTADGNLLSWFEYNLIMDYVIDSFILNNTGAISLSDEIEIVLRSHVIGMGNYFRDLYFKYKTTYAHNLYKFPNNPFQNNKKFSALHEFIDTRIMPNKIIHAAYRFNPQNIISPRIETSDNIIDWIITIKKMIIELREYMESQQSIIPEDSSKEDSENTGDKKETNINTTESSEDSVNPEKNKDNTPAGKPQQNVVDPTMPSKKQIASNIINNHKDYQKEAVEKIINSGYGLKEHNRMLQERINDLQKIQDEFANSVRTTDLEKLPEVMHADDKVTNMLFTDEVNYHRNSQFNKTLSKIYTRINSYGDSAAKMDYVWKNPRSLMYLQDDYLIQDVKELEKTGKKKIAVYVDISGSMGMGPAKTVNSILQTFSKELIDVDIWFWNDKIRLHRASGEYKPHKIEDFANGDYPYSNGNTCLHKVYEHAYKYYKDESELTVIIISDFEDNHALEVYNNNSNPNNNKHWQYLNVHIITNEYEKENKFEQFKKLNALLGVDNTMITTQILNF